MENKCTTTLRLCLQLNIRVCWLHPAALLGIQAFIFLGWVFALFFSLLFYFLNFFWVNLHHEITDSLSEWSWSVQERSLLTPSPWKVKGLGLDQISTFM